MYEGLLFMDEGRGVGCVGEGSRFRDEEVSV